MGRKIFGIPASDTRPEAPARPEPELHQVPAAPVFDQHQLVSLRAAPERPVATSAPALGGLREGLRELSANSIREVDPELVDDEGPRDRLDLDDASIVRLADSIRLHGQQVPIMIRPGATADRYRVVYGRRRLAALRHLGIPAKAILRHLDDNAAVLAQGQENSFRLDPSFIEKAIFVRDLRAAGYNSTVIEEALGIDRTTVSRLGTVAETLPDDVVNAIGAAHGVGRRQWIRLSVISRMPGIDIRTVTTDALGRLPKDSLSDDRLKAVLSAAEAAVLRLTGTAPETCDRGHSQGLKLKSGRSIGVLRRSRSAVALSFPLRNEPEFGQWLADNAERLAREMHERWLEARPEKEDE